ncbi:succinate dehydrogenase, hydrophobic membrane anchor protein [Erythrobacter sp. HKB08]|uniref:succinate dehydrogenase, hydrophobic membrane anchor protein n=1 Tax=Erythrobacter sp. HKB08 TaxID=2502843 RepID=UPI001008F2FC|nr:succinate dehydrogenase, hydrophobic membrane anchor protein [Erythrobacter sp. HKB08]
MGNGTSIGKVRGLGSAHEGAHHWLVQRFTAIGNLVLMLWLVASFILLPDLSYATMAGYLAKPVPAVAMALLIVSVFWHARLGLQVLVEDYVHTPGNKFALIALLNLATLGGAAFGIFCVARLALGGAA